LNIGNSHNQSPTDNTVVLPADMCCGNDILSLIDFVYLNLASKKSHSDQYFQERAILSCQSECVDGINCSILKKFPGDMKAYHSADKIVVEEGGDLAHTPVSNRVPELSLLMDCPYYSSLKVGCPLMMLCNLDSTKGLCNGTHTVFLKAQSHVLECRILGGSQAHCRYYLATI
jgi:hypothetical protein